MFAMKKISEMEGCDDRVCGDHGCFECEVVQRELHGNTPPSACSVPVDATLRGATDRVAGVVVGDNPYPETDNDHWRWMQGWTGAAMAQNGKDMRSDEGKDS